MPAYQVILSRAARKQLDALPKTIQRRMIAKLEAMEAEPHPLGSKKLQDGDGLWRFRVGDYRVIYSVDDGRLVVLVVRVGHRREVYR